MIVFGAVLIGLTAVGCAQLVHRRRVQRRREAAAWRAMWNGPLHPSTPMMNGRPLHGVHIVHVEERRPRVLLHAERRGTR